MDNYDPKYLIRGFHVRKVATAIAIFCIVVTAISIPFDIYEQIGNDGTDLLHPKRSVPGMVLCYIVATISPVCVILADTKEKAVLYLPQIILSIIEVISLIALTILWIFGTIAANSASHAKEQVHHYGAWEIVCVTLLLVFFTILIGAICNITMRARRYMLDEVETRVIPV